MNKTTLIAAAVGAALTALPAAAHNNMTSYYAPAGYLQDLELRVTHGCKGSPVKEVKVRIPDGVMRVQVENNRNWQIETKMRKLPKPIPGEGGNMITETVEEIIWKNPKSPMPAGGFFEGFKFRAALPDKPGEIVFFRSINVCVNGEERYIDLPKVPLNARTPDLGKKLMDFMTATPRRRRS
ncbi:MAG: YcnI family protein [Steroidobacteraceae bacterium]